MRKRFALILISFFLLAGCGSLSPHLSASSGESVSPLLYYPETTSAPTLGFSWDETGQYGELNLTTEASGDIYSCGPFGTDEGGGFLNQEMAIFFVNRRREPIYAPCDGILTYFATWESFEDAMGSNKGGEAWVRYGYNYAVGFRHIVTTGLTLLQGDLIHKGDIIGYCADRGADGIFFEFVLAQKDADKYYFLRPYDYFTTESKAVLLNIWNAAQYKDAAYNSVTNPWGDLEKFESEGGNNEIPHKGGFD